MRHTSIDDRQNTRFNNLADINACAGTGKVHGRHHIGIVFPNGDLHHIAGILHGAADISGADKAHHRGRGCHGKATDSKGLTDGTVAHIGVGIRFGITGEIEADRHTGGRLEPAVAQRADLDSEVGTIAAHRCHYAAMRNVTNGIHGGLAGGHRQVQEELIVGGKNGLEPVEKTIIDRCVRLVYQEYLADPVPEKMPILEDLYNLLRKQEEPEAQRLATSLEIYVTGSLNVFNHQTNVDINNRIVCFDIKELGKQLKKIGMLVIQDQVWNRVTMNRSAHKSTRYYVDEFHLLLKEEQTAAYSVEIWKRFRKWGGIPTGITQNIKDLLSSREIENIFENSDFIYMLNQASGDRQILAKQLNISPTQLSYVTNSNEGEGLLFYGNVIIPFVDRFPKNSLYKIMTTRLEETSEAG